MQILCFYHGFHILYSYCLVCTMVYMVEVEMVEVEVVEVVQMEVAEEMSYY